MAEQLPRGIEVLVSKASVDPEFRLLLLERRAAAAETIGLELTQAEAMVLTAAPREQLEAIIAKTKVPQEHRRAFLGQAAAVMVAAASAMSPTAAYCQFQGSRPDPAPPRPKTIEERVFGVVAKELKVLPSEVDRDTPLVEPAKTDSKRAANRKHLLSIAGDLRKEFNLAVPAKDAVKFQTAGEVVDYVKSTMKSQKSYEPGSKGHRPDLPRKRPAGDEAESEE